MVNSYEIWNIFKDLLHLINECQSTEITTEDLIELIPQKLTELADEIFEGTTASQDHENDLDVKPVKFRLIFSDESLDDFMSPDEDRKSKRSSSPHASIAEETKGEI